MRCTVPRVLQRNTSQGAPLSRAFTLIELIIVMAIIALLIGLVLLAMGGVSDSAMRADSANALRSMMRGYISYAGDNRQTLMPGYLDPNDITIGSTAPGKMRFDVTDIEGNSLSPEDAASYVWRLLPYLDNEWATLLVDYGSGGVEAKIQTEINDNVYGPATIDADADIGLGMQPAFGLNSIYVGGDGVHGGPDAVNRSPWNAAADPDIAKIAATRTSEVRSPGELIVFAPNRQANDSMIPAFLDSFDVTWGYVELRPPYINTPPEDEGSDTVAFGDPHWEVNRRQRGEVATAGEFSAGGGIPFARWSDNTMPTGRFDGSTSTADINALGPPTGATQNPQLKQEFMAQWWPFATGYRGSQQ